MTPLRLMARRAILVLALVLPSVQAVAAGPLFGCPRAGTIVELSGDVRLSYHGTDAHDPALCLFTSLTGQGEPSERAFLYGVHTMDSIHVLPEQMRDLLQALAGMEDTQRTATALVSGPRFNSMMRFGVAVEGPRTVTVPAGTFQAWVVREKGVGVFGNETKIDFTYWIDARTYAPLHIQETTNGAAVTLEAKRIEVQ